MMGATSFVKVTWRAPALAGACAEIACVSKIAAAGANKVTKRIFTRLIGLPSSHSSSNGSVTFRITTSRVAWLGTGYQTNTKRKPCKTRGISEGVLEPGLQLEPDQPSGQDRR